jgi:cytochrome d ubiquinol oxidase subunit I
MLAFPFPFIANTAGWLAAELGRQPWLVYGALRTEHGYSTTVTSGSVWFTLLGFMGMYALLALSFVFLLQRLFEEGPA